MSQSWRDLTFLHWAVDPALVADRMPPGVRPDTFDGRTYVGLIPFRMVRAGFGSGPAVPWLGSFLETNVRLYSVDDTGRRGIVFLSLDTDRAAVVAGARAGFGVPYRWARMRHRVDGRPSTPTTPACAGPAYARPATSSYAPAPHARAPSSTTSSAPAGACTRAGAVARSTSPTGTSPGPSTTPRCWRSTTA